jgi:DNA polymerase-3 subunit beta
LKPALGGIVLKIVCERAVLQKAVTTAGRAVSGKSSLSVLECLLFAADGGGLKVMGNDLDLGIETKPIEAEIIEEGMVAVDAKMMADIVRRLPESRVVIESDKNNVTLIKSGRSEFKVIGQNGEEFPFLPEVAPSASFSVPAGQLEDMIRRTIYCVGTDESKPVMTGELVELKDGEARVVAIDGFRIAWASFPFEGGEGMRMVVPGKAMGEISRLLAGCGAEKAVKCSTSFKHAMFELEDCVIVTRLIDGDFMNYEPIFSQKFTATVTAGREELLECLDRASLISKDGRKNPVKLTITDGMLAAASNTVYGSSFEELEIVLNGEGLEIAFNPRYIMEALRVIEDKEVEIMFTSPVSPCVIKGAGDGGFKYLALPLRVR